jgi:hypothetical protein
LSFVFCLLFRGTPFRIPCDRAAAYATALLIVFVVSCARQGFPPGGPDDKTPPEIAGTVPLQRATNVPATQPITFEFSEPMDERSVEDNLFIIPIPVEWPRVTWGSGSRIMTLAFPVPLRSGATSVITIGSKARDRQNNQMKDSFILTFSTGPTIENGRIRGRVIPYRIFGRSPETVAGVDVVAYRLNDQPAYPDPRSDIPDYATQTSSDGSYTLTGLSSARYRIFAIGDRNRDGFYTEGEDMIGVASGDVALAEGDTLALAPHLVVSDADTAMVQLTSVRSSDKNRAEFFFDREIDTEGVDLSIEGISLHGWFIPFGEPKKLSAATSDQSEGRKYPVARLKVRDLYGNPPAPWPEAPVFSGTARADTAALEISDWRPKVLIPGKDPIRMVFNRVLALPDTARYLIKDASGEDVTAARTGPNILELAPGTEWKENFTYLITFDRETLRGVAGNRLTGPGSQLSFRVVHPDTLGFIEGTVADSTGTENTVADTGGTGGPLYRLTFRHLDTETERKMEVRGQKEWKTGPVLPGRYVAYGFRDDNGDGKVGRGSVSPHRPAEPVYAYPDTITVVSRRMTGSIQFIFH